MKNDFAEDTRLNDPQSGLEWGDDGLRQYMLRVYNYMAGGLLLTGIVAYIAATSGFYASIAAAPLFWIYKDFARKQGGFDGGI